MAVERLSSDFNPETQIIAIRMSKEAFLKVKPGADEGPVMVGGLYVRAFFEDGLIILIPMAQEAKKN